MIELLMVLVIVGILTTVATGYFAGNVIAANRTEGRSALSEVASSLEKCRSLYGAYNSLNCNVALPVATDSNYYTVSATAIASSSFTLTATPVAGEPQVNDTDCTTMTLTNTGVKGGTPAGNACW